MRLKACDTVFFLDYPLEVCLEGVRSRIGKPREDMPWVEQEFDEEFRQWIEDFSRDQRPEICRLLEQYREGRKIVVFHSREEAGHYRIGEKDRRMFRGSTMEGAVSGNIRRSFWVSQKNAPRSPRVSVSCGNPDVSGAAGSPCKAAGS